MNIYTLIIKLDELADELYEEAGNLRQASKFLQELEESDLQDRMKELKQLAKQWIEDE